MSNGSRRKVSDVNKGDPLFIISTDKANIEIESPADGILSGLKAKTDEVIPVTAVIAYLLAPGEALPTKTAPQPAVTVSYRPRPKSRQQWNRR